MKSPELLVFGGTFDPPHVGHLLCARAALRRFPKADMWVVPSYAPPVAFGQPKLVEASFEHRFAMTEIMFSSLAECSHITVSSIEQGMDMPNYTYQTLREIRRITGIDEVALVIGEDQFRSFPAWYQAKAILKAYHLVVIARKDFQLPSCLDDPGQILDQLDIKVTFDSKATNAWSIPGSSKGIYLVHEYQSEAASREIRRQPDELSRNAWLIPEVLHYIDENRLYRSREG